MADTAPSMALVDGLTREQRKEQLDEIKTKKELAAEGKKVNLNLDPETQKMDEMKALILDATFGVQGGVGASEGADGSSTASDGSDASEGPQKGTPSVKKPNPEKEKADAEAAIVDPLAEQCKELDAQLGALYDQLVEEIKAVAQPDVKVETAAQLKAGAVQFLRQCNATLEVARNTLESAKSVVEANNAKEQSIKRAAEDLEKRSDAYRTMTNGGVKNAGQE